MITDRFKNPLSIGDWFQTSIPGQSIVGSIIDINQGGLALAGANLMLDPKNPGGSLVTTAPFVTVAIQLAVDPETGMIPGLVKAVGPQAPKVEP
jgi:hypothetical protein